VMPDIEIHRQPILLTDGNPPWTVLTRGDQLIEINSRLYS
jgi:hypothetical protein